MAVAAIVVAAGAGTRLGASRPKAFVEILGEPLYAHASRALIESAAVDALIVVVPEGCQTEAQIALQRTWRVLGDPSAMAVTVVVGGASRQASVERGLDALAADVDVVLVHDAARALAPVGLIQSVVAAVRSGRHAVVPGLAVADTVKQVGRADESGAQVVEATLERAVLRMIQTPQGFSRDLLERAHRSGADLGSSELTSVGDDAGLIELIGGSVHVVPGDPLAFKITTPHDLLIASVLLGRAS